MIRKLDCSINRHGALVTQITSVIFQHSEIAAGYVMASDGGLAVTKVTAGIFYGRDK
jgi:hypothetical protein